MTGLELAGVFYLMCGLAVAASFLDLLTGQASHRVNTPARRRVVEKIQRGQGEDPLAVGAAVGVFIVATILLWPWPVANGVRRRWRERSR